LYKLRLDPFERMSISPGESMFAMKDFYGNEFWSFVYLQEEVGILAKTAIDYPPMQAGGSSNLDAVKKKIADHHATGD
jgi:hypothetical protein